MAALDDDVSVLLQTYDALDAFLREMDVLDVKNEPPASPSTSVSSTSSAPRKRKHDSSKTTISNTSADNETRERPVRRRRQKDELLQLRQQALEMEAQLQGLQNALTAAQPRKTEAKSLESQLWESCALHERRAKLVVEDENARLRGIASKELKVSLEIEKLLVKCYASAVRALLYVLGRRKVSDGVLLRICFSWRSCRSGKTRNSRSMRATCFSTRCWSKTRTRASATSRARTLCSQRPQQCTAPATSRGSCSRATRRRA